MVRQLFSEVTEFAKIKDMLKKKKNAKKKTIQTISLRTFALIVSAHPYCARKFTCHVIHERAR